jgi:hypothetical protein
MDPASKDGPALTSELNPGASTGHIKPNKEPEGEIGVVARPPDPDVDWQKLISKYLQLGTIPNDETKTRCLVCQAKGCLIHNDEQYHCSTSSILQRCIPLEEGKALFLDVHEGVYGHHASSRSMVEKAFSQGFYCLTTASDVAQIVRSCRGCQYFARQIHAQLRSSRQSPLPGSSPCWPRPCGTLQEGTRGA